MAAIGVWTAYFVNRRTNESLDKRIAALKPLARELEIKDPNKIAVVKCEELWYDENQWDLYLPSDGFRLVVATRQIDGEGQPAVNKSVPLPAGKCRLELTQTDVQTGFEVKVTRNGQELLKVEEEKGWDPGGGSSGGGQYTISEQFPPDKPVVLFRRRFTVPTKLPSGATSHQSPTGPANGLILWIEPAPEQAQTSTPHTPWKSPAK